MKILDREIGPGQRPYLIAEMSGNHNQSLARALEIVDAAARRGPTPSSCRPTRPTR